MNWRNRFQLDDDAQVDGDESGAVQFQAMGGGQPWLREGIPPWHMWGNSQTVRVMAETTDTTAPVGTGQLVKISYKRPETWHFLVAARIISAARPLSPTNDIVITVTFDAITGIGRSQTQLPGFAVMNWGWLGSQEQPLNQILFTQQGKTPALRTIFDAGEGIYIPDPTSVQVFNEMVGQDIQVNCRINVFMHGIDEGDQNYADVEVSAFLAPKSHVRPDWFVKGPAEVMFPGGETQGR